MKITKQSLYDFIHEKIKVQLETAREEFETYVEKNVKPHLIDNTKDIAHLKSGLTELADELETFLENANDYGSWSPKRNVRDLREVASVRDRVITTELSNIKAAIRNNNHYDKYHMEFVVGKASKKLKPTINKIDDLKTLKRELDNAVKTSTTGKQAYKNLVSLGVDMKEFKGSENQLPAVQKLSVNPCLVNGDCN
ncbi:hypothetical protein [Virgibacillus salexigens]|uniref:hypothetical protein n=1 Tax=Virgibacillus TaxID=84406 RepID=UPI0013707FE0|nr:hypothetical protein [Virgibacillus massiliensis]MYL41791.1 hypothetical protein [Virgibacillus massiliensis]